MLTMEPIFEEGKQEGIEIGRKIGKEIYAIQVAFKLLVTCPEWADDQIAKIAGLSIPMVTKLRRKI